MFVKDEINRLITKTDYIMKAVDRKMDDEGFKREEFERFNHVFHIGPKSPGGASSSSEQKNDDLDASKVGMKQSIFLAQKPF